MTSAGHGAASGQAGAWMCVENRVTSNLIAVDGSASGATLSLSAAPNPECSDHPGTSDDGAKLLDDRVPPDPFFVDQAFSGLEPGEYEVYVDVVDHGFHPGYEEARAIGAGPSTAMIGDWSVAFVQGESYERFRNQVVDGTLVVRVNGFLGLDHRIVNGSQLVRLAPGDGTATDCGGADGGLDCSCFNFAGPIAGCANSTGSGALLETSESIRPSSRSTWPESRPPYFRSSAMAIPASSPRSATRSAPASACAGAPDVRLLPPQALRPTRPSWPAPTDRPDPGRGGSARPRFRRPLGARTGEFARSGARGSILGRRAVGSAATRRPGPLDSDESRAARAGLRAAIAPRGTDARPPRRRRLPLSTKGLPALHCLFLHPRFVSRSFWNYRATCDLVGARYPAAPLGLITVAAMCPESWECRLVDCNVQELSEQDVAWADLVFLGGMIAQQTETLRLIEELAAAGKTVVVGGPDATSSPHLYAQADHLVLGEAEVTFPRWLADFQRGAAERVYSAGGELADLSTSPLPRFDLLDFDKYLHVGVQLARGCPFVCEFCDIIELFGRRPRLKRPERMLAELERLYELGYRGHIDFVDDNFIGNKREVKLFLAQLRGWLEEHRWPFEFSTEASVNLADDEALLELMRETGFFAIFVGIESPDEATLEAAQKRQNTRRSLAESLQRIYSYGIFVNTGYIVGFDTEAGGVADGVLELIEASSAPVNMVGLLFALPNTQLQRRLAKEGRLLPDFEVAADGVGDQCTAGLNFLTKRPRREILEDYRRIIDESYAPDAYFARVAAVARALDCSRKRLRQPLRHVVRDLGSFVRMLWRMGVRSDYRWPFWRTLARLLRSPRSLRYSMALMALYLHFGSFRKYLVAHLSRSIEDCREQPVRVALAPQPLAR